MSMWTMTAGKEKSPPSVREVNKNNLLGKQFYIFVQKSRKIINWVGSFQFWAPLAKIMVFSLETLGNSRPLNPLAHWRNRISWSEVLLMRN